MKEKITFGNLEEATIEKKNRKGVWRPLHTNFVGSNVVVVFVNGTDDPENSQESIDKKIKFQKRKELSAKLEDDSITFDELKEYLRLN